AGTFATGFDIGFDVLNADGTTQLFAGGVVVAADARPGDQRNPQVAGGPNRALVVYEDTNGEATQFESHISAKLFNEATNTISLLPVLIADAGAGLSKQNPDVAYIGDGRFAIVYDLSGSHTILARIYNSDNGALSPEIAVSTATFAAAFPKVAATQD